MRKKKVLIVEDEPVTAMDEHEIFRRHGYQVVNMLFTGEAALEQISQDRPDVIIMDIMLLGELNGLDAARMIRDRHDLPIVFVTALSSLQETLKFNDGSTEGISFVGKPFTEQELIEAVERVLGPEK